MKVKKGASTMKFKDVFEISGNGVMYILTATQTKEVFEIISLVLSILISILIIVGKIITWYKKAKEDGKITADELKEGVDIIKDGTQEIKEKVDKKGDN